jgi:excinuclease ABC subunit C
VTGTLDRVAGVGPARRAALLRAFGSVAALSTTPAEEIAARAGVPLALAIRVADALRPEPAPAPTPADPPRSGGHGEAA